MIVPTYIVPIAVMEKNTVLTNDLRFELFVMKIHLLIDSMEVLQQWD